MDRFARESTGPSHGTWTRTSRESQGKGKEPIVRVTTAVPLAALLAACGLYSGCAGLGSKSTEELRMHADEAFLREEYKRSIAFDSEILRREPNDYKATIQRGIVLA